MPQPPSDPNAAAATDPDHERMRETLLALERMTERYELAAAAGEMAAFERIDGADEMYIADALWPRLGYAPGELPSRASTLLGLLHAGDIDAFQRASVAACQRLQPFDVTCRLRTRDGGHRWFRVRASSSRQSDGSVRLTGVLSDVHEAINAREALERDRAQLEQIVAERTGRLQAALAEAEQRSADADRAHAAKSRFLAHMSHEIRTPLNGAIGLTELALRLAESPAQRRYLELGLQSGRALLALIDDVLEVSRLEAGSIELAHEPFDLADTVAEAMRSMVTTAHAADLGWRLDWVGDTTWVRGDAARVRQILVNLIGNAARFTEHGEVRVRVLAEPLDADQRCRLRIDVEDTGPGIEPELLARLFDAFVQGDASLSRRHGGSGLGLTIARALARAMGGDLTARSTPGAGSTFTLALTLPGLPDPRPALVQAPGRIGLVTPSEDTARWLARRFERLGWRSVWWPSVDAALAALSATPRDASAPEDDAPRLLLLSDALALVPAELEALRTALPAARLALLVRPEWHDDVLERRARALGVVVAVRPLTPRDLLTLGAAESPIDEALPSVDDAPALASPATGAEVLLVEDNAVNRLIAEEFLKALGLSVRSVVHGGECIEACLRAPPQLVLMDIQMPVMDGLEATRQLRALQRDGRLPQFPIIALSAHAMASDRELAADAGMDDYLTKPILLEQLRDAIAPWLPVADFAPTSIY